MAVLVLYMDKTLGWSDSRKGTYYGLFLALCYFVPLLGGWLGDRVFGRRATVEIGALMMAAGYVGLALSSAAHVIPFYVGLFLIGFGTGIFKVNMSVMVGNLYADKPELKDAGFNIFYMAVNIGAAVAPLIATFVGVTWDNYNINFWICAAGLLVGAVIFRAGLGALGAGRPPDARARPPSWSTAAPISAVETRQRIATLVTLFIIVILFWVAFYQDFFGLTLFAERSTKIFKFLRPETYQFFEPFYIVILTPVLLALFAWSAAAKKEPSTPVKIFLGMLFMGAGDAGHGLCLPGRRRQGRQQHVAGLADRDVFHRHDRRDPDLAHGPVLCLQGGPAQDRRPDDGRLDGRDRRRQLRLGLARQVLQRFRPPSILPPPDRACLPLSAVLVLIFLKRLKRFAS